MNRKVRNSRRGSATVELAVVLPLMIFLLMGTWEVGCALNVTMVLQNAAGVGARQASVGTQTNSQVQQVVLNYLTAASVPTKNAVVTVSDVTQPGVDVSQATGLDQVKVTVSVPYSDVRWGVSGFVIKNTTQMVGAATYSSVKVDPYPGSIVAPAGN